MLAALVTAGFFAVGATLLWVAWAGSQRRLARNGLLGLPMPTIRSSEAAWHAAHEAAAGPLGLGGGIALTCGVGIAAVGTDTVGQVLAGIGAALVVVCVTSAVLNARRCASVEPES